MTTQLKMAKKATKPQYHQFSATTEFSSILGYSLRQKTKIEMLIIIHPV